MLILEIIVFDTNNYFKNCYINFLPLNIAFILWDQNSNIRKRPKCYRKISKWHERKWEIAECNVSGHSYCLTFSVKWCFSV